jgi:hypothetical protein
MTTPTDAVTLADVALMRDFTGRCVVTYARSETLHRIRTTIDGERVGIVDVASPAAAHDAMLQSMTAGLALLNEKMQSDHEPLRMESLDMDAYAAYCLWLRGREVFNRAFVVRDPNEVK